MSNPYPINDRFVKRLDFYCQKPSQPLLLLVPDGLDQIETLKAVTDALGQHLSAKLLINVLNEEMITIPISSIAEIVKLSSLTRTKEQPSINIIYGADKMTLDAQNSFLKLLEEPPKNIYFVLAASSSDPILDTIKSRVTLIEVAEPSLEQVTNFFSDTEQSTISKYYQLFGGRVEVIRQILEHKDSQGSDLQLVKNYLLATNLEKFQILETIEKDRAKLVGFIDGLITTYFLMLQGSIKTSSTSKTKSLTLKLEKAMNALDNIVANGSIKLNVCDLVL